MSEHDEEEEYEYEYEEVEEDEDELDEEEDSGPRQFVADSLRKALVNGLSAVLMTEEGIRQVVSDLRLPKDSAKDAMNYLSNQAERSRREVMRIVGAEVKSFLESTDMAGLLRKSLAGMKVEVRAELKLTEDDELETQITSARVASDEGAKRGKR